MVAGAETFVRGLQQQMTGIKIRFLSVVPLEDAAETALAACRHLSETLRQVARQNGCFLLDVAAIIRRHLATKPLPETAAAPAAAAPESAPALAAAVLESTPEPVEENTTLAKAAKAACNATEAVEVAAASTAEAASELTDSLVLGDDTATVVTQGE